MKRLRQALDGQIPRPRPRIRVKRMDNAGTMVTSRVVRGTSVTSSFGEYTDNVLVAPAVYRASDAGGSVLSNYQEYVVNTMTAYWTPTIGTTTPGIVYIAYYDNPELIFNVSNGLYTTAQFYSLAQNAPHSASGPVWQPIQLSIPNGPNRLKIFSTDTNAPILNQSAAGLTVQGIFLIAVVGSPITSAVGVISYEYSATGRHLFNNAIASV